MSNRFLPRLVLRPTERIEIPPVLQCVRASRTQRALEHYAEPGVWSEAEPPDLSRLSDTTRLPAELSLRELVELNVRDAGACEEFALAHGMPTEGFYCRLDVAIRNLAAIRRTALHLLAVYEHDDLESGLAVWIDPTNWPTDEAYEDVIFWSFEAYMSDPRDPAHRRQWEDMAWAMFASTLSTHIREWFEPVKVRELRTGYGIGLTCALAIELRNIVVEDPEPRCCANCSRLFFVQRGTAKHGQHRRSGEVRYCSDVCRRRYQERQRYARRKEERRGN
jgi:hypothetical protein